MEEQMVELCMNAIAQEVNGTYSFPRFASNILCLFIGYFAAVSIYELRK